MRIRLAALLLFPSILTAQTGTKGAFIALSVADVSSMTEWYRAKLDLKVKASGEAPNKIAKFAILEGNGMIVELIQHTKANTRRVAAPTVTDAYQIHGIFKSGLIVEKIDELYSALKRKNVPIAYDLMSAKDVDLRSFSVRDPEGNMLQFFGK